MSHSELAEAAHLRGCDDEVAARELFKRSVRMVEIEVFSYCNRVCWFCPNSNGSRLGENQYMSEPLYRSILQQLASIDYDGTITYSRYNEPLADRIILKRISEAKFLVPRAKLHTNTNGDYVTRDYLADLQRAGLASLNIQVYLKNHEQYDHDDIKAKADFLCRKIGLPYVVTRDTRDEWFMCKIEHPGMDIQLYGRNFARNGTSRGDTVPIAEDYVRTSPCMMPFWAVYLDFNGAMMPCCNLRSDISTHREAIIAHLDENTSLFRHFAGATLSSWRRSLVGFNEKPGLCRTCRFAIEPDSDAVREHLKLVAHNANSPYPMKLEL